MFAPTQDILFEVLEHAYFDASLLPDTRGLAKYSRVGREWRTPAQTLLFRQVSLPTHKSVRSFRRVVEESSELAAMVRVLSISAPDGSDWSVEWAHIILLCKHMYQLDLDVYKVPRFSDDTISLLRDAPTISALQISSTNIPTRVAYQLLKIWASIRHLSLKCLSLWDDRHQGDTTPPFSLQEFRWGNVSPPNRRYLDWILKGSKGSLEILDINSELDTDLLEGILKSYGSTLRSLRLRSTTPTQIPAFQHCTRLQEYFQITPIPPSLLRVLPLENLEHISTSAFNSDTLFIYAEFIPKMPRLRAFTLYRQIRILPDVSILELACAARDVELRSPGSGVS
jgi:hypothetical protein